MGLNKKDLIDWFVKGCKSEESFKIGTEHEKFVYKTSNLSPVTYDEESGICNILKSLTRFGWQEVKEGNNLIALKKDEQSITLEPGGQLELSGAPLDNIHKTCREVYEHLEQVKEVGNELNVGFLGIGSRIEGKLANHYWMPKERYKIMKAYMPKVGRLGLDMMADTCTVQVNLDYSSENDMMRKLKIGFLLQPMVTALFASSPFEKMKPSNYISRRSAIWFDVDKDRCGVPEFILNKNFGFEQWVDYALSVPMYFIYRDGKYINCAGESFKDYMSRDSIVLKGYEATIKDWEAHLSTIFTEVRLKQFIEFRGADSGPWKSLCALPALWVGLLYNNDSLDAAEELANSISLDLYEEMYRGVPLSGLDLEIGGRNIKEYAKDMLNIAKIGLRNRSIKDSAGNDETGYLNQLEEVIYTGMNHSKKMLSIWEKDKKNSLETLYKEFSY